MQKIACIFSYQKSSWVSCQKIVFNLHKAYAGLKDTKLINFNLSPQSEAQDIYLLSKEIISSKPNTIVFLDHKPHPLPLIQFLVKNWDGDKFPRIVFHIFGDFTLFYSQWEKVGELLKGKNVDFVVASERQKDLIDKFLSTEAPSQVCPFPVNEDEFFFRPELRENQRKEWGLKNDELACVFTGRFSRQKKTHTLLKAFAEAIESIKNPKTHLFLYGHADHIGDPFVGQWETEGEYFRTFYRIFKELPAETQKRIHFMGNVPNLELKAVYQAADLLVNLSVHNDEDFGMSVAEAQTSGLPALVTSWGGLASFTYPEYPEATTFIPVKIADHSKAISRKRVASFLSQFIQERKEFDRKKISILALKKFGIKAAQQEINSILESGPHVFRGFSPFFEKVVTETQSSSTPYIDHKKQINHLYRELYSAYVGNTERTISK